MWDESPKVVASRPIICTVEHKAIAHACVSSCVSLIFAQEHQLTSSIAFFC